jgi:hypothetical protein
MCPSVEKETTKQYDLEKRKQKFASVMKKSRH